MNRQTSPREASGSPTFSPLYRQIKDLMMRSLEAGEWGPGDAIPSEVELAARFQVSQGTVRKAIDELSSERHLVRRQGKGTFVAAHSDPRSFFRFLRLVPNEGAFPHSQSIPLECWRGRAGNDVARVLGLEVGAPVIMVRRLLKFNDEPVVIDEIYLPGDTFSDLSLDILKTSDQSFYSLYETRYGVRMVRADERLRAIAADKTSADLLAVPEGTPLLLVERISYSYGNKPVEWRRGYYSTQNHHYLNELS